ncbi:TVP38/TMEM64 family protein [Treponema zioleckii]|uniref:TVP38/TMEM64 family protein n=1 Tax=Treponema zioleckii TaxID=331680 RepID=UPI00168B1DD8|nr:TVP38/TMEM64 family protein [Treponema zioleckii]
MNQEIAESAYLQEQPKDAFDSENNLQKNGTQKKRSFAKHIFAGIFLLFFVAVGTFFIYQYKNGRFSDAATFRDYIQSFGYFGFIILTVFQCVKVLYAIIPGTIGCIAGAGLFGTIPGFICNYIGICSGSILAFLISRKFGDSMMRLVFSEKRYNQCLKWMQKWHKSYSIFLWIAILLPISPDDFLCYFTGLTKMKFKRFLIIILTSKPLTILVYSLIFGYLGEQI